MKRSPFPLAWPDGWARTVNALRSKPKFSTMFTRDRDAVIRQLSKRGHGIAITSNLPTRNDGLPYNAGADDPGVAVYWTERGRERVIACDRWRLAADNMRAIDMSLVAMRALDRFGASGMVERAFDGLALPAGATPLPRKPWREVFGVELIDLEGAEMLALVKLRYRKAIAVAHPDHGGAIDDAAELNTAMADAERELSP
jgi:hypothetical protein